MCVFSNICRLQLLIYTVSKLTKTKSGNSLKRIISDSNSYSRKSPVPVLQYRSPRLRPKNNLPICFLIKRWYPQKKINTKTEWRHTQKCPQKCPTKCPTKCQTNMSDKITDKMSDKTSDKMSDKMSDKISDKMSEQMSGKCPTKMSE